MFLLKGLQGNRIQHQNIHDLLAVSNLFDREDGLGMVQARYFYCALYYYYISSTSDHQTLDPGGWGPLSYIILFKID